MRGLFVGIFMLSAMLVAGSADAQTQEFSLSVEGALGVESLDQWREQMRAKAADMPSSSRAQQGLESSAAIERGAVHAILKAKLCQAQFHFFSAGETRQAIVEAIDVIEMIGRDITNQTSQAHLSVIQSFGELTIIFTNDLFNLSPNHFTTTGDGCRLAGTFTVFNQVTRTLEQLPVNITWDRNGIASGSIKRGRDNLTPLSSIFSVVDPIIIVFKQ